MAPVANGQVISVEKSIVGIQTGFLGIWLNNEAKLSDKWALKSEIGFDSGIFDGSFYDKPGFLMTPVLTVEPRWYYNLAKRSSKLKNIKKNSGNFIGIRTSYNPDWFVISNYKNLTVINQLSLIPKWAIRRSIGNNFNFETGLGIGYRYYFAKSAGYPNNEREVGLLKDLAAQLNEKLKADEVEAATYFKVGDNMADEVIKIATLMDTDLIVITANMDQSVPQCAVSPYTRHIINHAHYPVLSIKPLTAKAAEDALANENGNYFSTPVNLYN